MSEFSLNIVFFSFKLFYVTEAVVLSIAIGSVVTACSVFVGMSLVAECARGCTLMLKLCRSVFD